jgi:enterochelin esterase-like enzyme
MANHDVTFTWSESDPGRPALAVLLRLVALTDHAHDDRDLSPYLMRPQPGGDWELTMPLPSTLRSSYQFCPIRDAALADEIGRGGLSDESWSEILALGEPDPRRPPTFTPGTVYGNPNRAPSIVDLPDAPPQPWRQRRPEVPRGTLVRYELGGEPPSVVHVHQPSTLSTDVAIVFDAKFWLCADILSTLDNLGVDRVIPPLTTVLVESIHGATRHIGLTHSDLFEPFLVDELVPWLRGRSDIGRIVLAGQSLGGLTVSWAALRHPELFGRVAISSMAAWWPGDDHGGLTGAQILEAYGQAGSKPIRFYLDVGSRERELLASVQAFRNVLMGHGYDMLYREYEGGHDLACWLGGLADGLVALLGSEMSEAAGEMRCAGADDTHRR